MNKRKAIYGGMASFLLGTLTLAGAVTAGKASAAPLKNAMIQSVKVDAEGNALKLAFSASGPVQLRAIPVLDGKPVLVFQAAPAILTGGKVNQPVAQANIRDVRVAQFSPDAVRIVVDLKQKTNYKSAVSQNGRHVYLSLMPLDAAVSAPSTQAADVVHARPAAQLRSPLKSFAQKLNQVFVAKAVKRKKKTYRAYSAPDYVTYSWKHADLPDVIRLLADRMHLNVLIDNGVTGSVTLDLKNVPAPQALSMILALNGYSYRQIGNVLVVATPDKLDKVPTAPVAMGPQATQVIPLENAKADSIQSMIAQAYPGVKVNVDSRLNALIVQGSVGAIRQVKSLAAQLDQPMEAAAVPQKAVIALNYADQKDVVGQLKPLLPADADLIADERTNTIIVIGSQYAIDTAKAFISAVDVPSPQVMLEMQVVSIDDTANKELGIEWPGSATTNFVETAAGEPGPNGTSQLPATGGSPPTANSLTLQNMGIHTFVRDNMALKAIIHWAVSHSKAKILGSPRVATLNNKEATIQLGDHIAVPYFDPRAGIYQALYIDAGVILKVTPKISPDGSITVHVVPQVSEVTGFNQNFPSLATRQADTWVRVKNGETIVIGGLLRENSTTAITKIPLLGDIPILGEFFRHHTTTHDKTDLVISITPTLLANH